jgi:hypothetical protein
MHDFLGVEVGNELVSIRFHFFDVHVEFLLGEIYSLQQTTEKRWLVSDDISPVVLPTLVTEKLVPLQDADVEKVAVRIRPELPLKYGLPSQPSSLVEREIAEGMTTENSDSSE